MGRYHAIYQIVLVFLIYFALWHHGRPPLALIDVIVIVVIIPLFTV